jgi:hypothetical protein
MNNPAQNIPIKIKQSQCLAVFYLEVDEMLTETVFFIGRVIER